METLLQTRRRQRYHVTIKGNGQQDQVVVIAYSSEEMKSLVNKLYKHIIIDEKGLTSGIISYEVSDLV